MRIAKPLALLALACSAGAHAASYRVDFQTVGGFTQTETGAIKINDAAGSYVFETFDQPHGSLWRFTDFNLAVDGQNYTLADVGQPWFWVDFAMLMSPYMSPIQGANRNGFQLNISLGYTEAQTLFLASSGVPGFYRSNGMTSTLAPVPEPATVWMMVAGVAALGFLVRRKRT